MSDDINAARMFSLRASALPTFTQISERQLGVIIYDQLIIELFNRRRGCFGRKGLNPDLGHCVGRAKPNGWSADGATWHTKRYCSPNDRILTNLNGEG